MAFNNDNRIIEFKPATPEQKQQVSGLKQKLMLTGILASIGLTGVTSAVTNADATTQVPNTGVESTMEDNTTDFHEQVGEMFAQKLNGEVGVTLTQENQPAVTSEPAQVTNDTPIQAENFMSTPMEEKLAQTSQPVDENVEGVVIK